MYVLTPSLTVAVVAAPPQDATIIIASPLGTVPGTYAVQLCAGTSQAETVSYALATPPGVPGELTTRVAEAVWTRLPLVPVIVRVYVPVGVVDAVWTVSVEVPDPLTEVGLNVPVAPVGNPLKVNPTEPVNPPVAVTDGVNVVLPPGATLCEEGDDVRVKLGAPVTPSVTVAVWTRLPSVPVIVSV